MDGSWDKTRSTKPHGGRSVQGEKATWLVAARGDGSGPIYSATEAEKARRAKRGMPEKGFWTQNCCSDGGGLVMGEMVWSVDVI